MDNEKFVRPKDFERLKEKEFKEYIDLIISAGLPRPLTAYEREELRKNMEDDLK